MSPAKFHALPFRQQGEIPCFEEKKPGWSGYIEWEKYPEKKAAEILAKYDFPHVSYTLSPTELLQKSRAIAAHHWRNEKSEDFNEELGSVITCSRQLAIMRHGQLFGISRVPTRNSHYPILPHNFTNEQVFVNQTDSDL